MTTAPKPAARFAERIAGVRPGEGRAVGWAAAYLLLLLSSYYVLRPVRETMGITGGVENLQWLFTGTFVGMLAFVPAVSWAVARLGRRLFVPVVYQFFVLNLIAFYGVWEIVPEARVWVARVFYVWTSVFNLAAISVMWSLMADLFRPEQSRRLFGLIAAGGSIGAILGPGLTATLAPRVGTMGLLWVAAIGLELSIVCASRVGKAVGEPDGSADQPVGGSIWGGVVLLFRTAVLRTIAGYVVLLTATATLIYFAQARIVAAAIPTEVGRTVVFARIDLAVNVLALIGQSLLAGRLVRWLGLGAVLAILPIVTGAAFAALWLAPTLGVLVVAQVLRRAANYALAKPAREALFTPLSREAKYKSKAAIDTVVYRGGDAVTGWIFAGLTAVGLGISAIAALAIPVAVGWVFLARHAGRLGSAAQSETPDPQPPPRPAAPR